MYIFNFKKWSTISLVIYAITYMISILYIYENTIVKADNLIISYIPLVSLMAYLFILAPFAIKGFDTLLKKHLCMMAIMQLVSLLLYFSLRIMGEMIGTFIIKVIAIFIIILLFILQAMIISDIKRIDIHKMKEYVDFVTEYTMPFFELKEIRGNIRNIWFFRILSISVLYEETIYIFYLCFFAYLMYNILLHKKIVAYYTEDIEISKKISILTRIEIGVMFLMILCIFFKIYPVAILILISSGFKIPFIKEEIQSYAYMNRNETS